MDTDDIEELSQGGADKQPAKTLEQRMAELGLHHIGESAEDVRRRLGPHHDYDVLNRCKRCGAHKARFAEDEEPCESEADRLAAEVKRLSAALEASDRRVETREAEIKRLNEGAVALGKRISELEADIDDIGTGNELLRDAADKLAAENTTQRTRIDAALAILRTPGTWSDFAQRAIKALEGK